MTAAPCLAALLPLVLLVQTHIMTHHFAGAILARPAAALTASAIVLMLVLRSIALRWRVASLAVVLWFVLLGLFPLVVPPSAPPSTLAGTAFTVLSLGLALAGARLVSGSAGVVIGGTVSLLTLWLIASAALTASALWPPAPWHEAVARIAARSRSIPLMPGKRPDIYYVVLDGMARGDVLERLYGLDINPEIAELESLGVYIPRRSRSNYSMTQLSLASSLNMQYLDELPGAIEEENDRRPLHRLTTRGGMMGLLRARGYEVVLVRSDALIGYEHAEADRALGGLPNGPSELEYALLSRTPLRGPYLDRVSLAAHREKVLSSFDLIESVQADRPMFVMAHILCPHPPFVLAADGTAQFEQERFSFIDGEGFPGTREQYLAGYRAQMRFTLRRITALMRHIAATTPDALVVIHGDHGPGLGLVNTDASRTDAWERLAIFSAYYPARGPGGEHPPDDISPVNALRWALRTGLGARLPLLPNRSYLSDYERPFRWVEIPEDGPGMDPGATLLESNHP